MMQIWHAWLIFGIVLWTVEIFTPGFVAGVFGTACIVTAAGAYLGASFLVQMSLFVVSTIALFILVRPLVYRYVYPNSAHEPTNVEALIGKEGIVVEEFEPDGGSADVKIGGELWRGISTDGRPLMKGQRVVVRRVEGVKVVVDVVRNPLPEGD